MKNNNGIVWVIVIVVILAIILAFSGSHKGGAASSDPNTITIGVVAPMTGPKGALGEGLQQSILLAQHDMGSTKKKYSFIYEDSAGDAVKSATAVQKLISVDHVQALVAITSQDGNIVSKAANEAHIPFFGIANDTHVEQGDYAFAHWAPASKQAQLMVQELQKRGLKKVAFLMQQNDAWVATYDEFQKAIVGTNIAIVYNDKFTDDTTDFKTMLGNAQKAKPDVILDESFSPMIEIIARQAKELGITTPITSITGIGTAKDLTAFEGDWFVSGKLSDDNWIARFTAQAGYAPTIGSNYGYDITQILIKVFDNATDTSGPAIVQALNSFDYTSIKSAVGQLTGLDPNGRVISDAALLMVKDGKQVNATN